MEPVFLKGSSDAKEQIKVLEELLEKATGVCDVGVYIIFPKPNLSKRYHAQYIRPYLLRKLLQGTGSLVGKVAGNAVIATANGREMCLLCLK